MTAPKNEERASGLERISIFGYMKLKVDHTDMKVPQAGSYIMLDLGQDLGCSYSFACI